ncbi:hypothetical protein [Spirosoma areae]
MATTELKQEINQIVNKLPDELLSELLAYLRQVEKSNTVTVQFTSNFRKILTEDRELLSKLAQ